MKRCTKIAEVISAYVDNAANPLEQLAMQEHIKACPLCKAELEFQYSLKAMMSSTYSHSAMCTADVSSAVMARLAATPKVPVRTGQNRFMVAAVMAIVMLTTALTINFENKTKPQVIETASYDYADYIYQHLSDDFMIYADENLRQVSLTQ